jgi:hypothetical protein
MLVLGMGCTPLGRPIGRLYFASYLSDITAKPQATLYTSSTYISIKKSKAITVTELGGL